jgi:hypothetical protein
MWQALFLFVLDNMASITKATMVETSKIFSKNSHTHEIPNEVLVPRKKKLMPNSWAPLGLT